MALQLILGSSRSGKTTRIMKEIAEKDALQRIFYIVPEQMTLSSQQKLLAYIECHGVLNTEVLSFNRFAHRIFEEVGNPASRVLDDMGKSLLLYQIAGNLKDRLVYYGESVSKPGFIGQMKLMITEMLQYQLSADDIREKVAEGSFSPTTVAKWHDILLIFDEYSKSLSDGAISSEQTLDYLSDRLSSSQTVKEALFFFDEFSGFTPQQYNVIEKLLQTGADITVSLVLPEAVLSEVKQTRKPAGIFGETAKTYLKLTDLAEKLGIGQSVVSCKSDSDRLVIPTLREAIFDYSKPSLSREEKESQKQVYMSLFGTKNEEVSALMRRIRGLLKEENYRQRDIAVLVPCLSEYEHILGRALETYHMDGFVDVKTPLSAHPFAQLILKALNACATGFGTEDTIAILKTGLSGLLPDELDMFENESLALSRRGAEAFCIALEAREEWEKAPLIAAALRKLAQSQKGKATVSKRLDSLSDFLDALSVADKMQEMADRLEHDVQEGKMLKQSRARLLRRSMEYRQLFDFFNQIKESVASFLGSMEVDAKAFYSIVNLGFSQYRMASIPPSLDQIFIGDIGSSRPADCKVLFIVGFGENSFPGETDNPGLFTRSEREALLQKIEMAPGSNENINLRYFGLYSLLGKVSEKVYFSCYSGDSDGGSNPVSLLWNRIEMVVGKKPWPSFEELPGPEAALLEEGLSLPKEALEYLKETEYQNTVKIMEAAQSAVNKKEKLNTKAVKELLADHYSVSQIENYVSCPFSYFAKYILNLKPRALPEVRVLDDGILNHEILQLAGKLLSTAIPEGMSEEEAHLDTENQVSDILTGNLKKDQYFVYQTTARYRAYWQRLQEAAADTVYLLRKQVSDTEFVPREFEWRFGKESAPITLTVNGEEKKFVGTIDRIDVLREDGKNYLRIVDYKSSSKSFDEARTLAGLTLQLPIYLDVALKNYHVEGDAPDINKPAGFFYVNFKAESESDARLCGLANADGVVLKKMDRSLDKPGKQATGKALRFVLDKDGKPTHKNSQAANEEQFKLLGEFALSKVKENAEKIEAGEIQAEPYDFGEQGSSCTYCDFYSVCRFDPQLPGVRPKKVKESKDFWGDIGYVPQKETKPED